ncbi:MAG TPA: alpha/beta hydrolase, partial [Methanoregula sp.]|nr:alpha/beta hydrolase [Methanoregula sp.]
MPYLCAGWENSGNIELYYDDLGEGRPVVLIHGWPLSAASWEKQVPVLLDAGYRVIAYDRRGFGRSSQPSSGYTYDTFAEDLNKLLTSLDITDATLVGFSMGGGEVARYLAIYGSRRVSQAAFISAIPPFLLRTEDNPTGVDGEVFEGIRRGIVNDRPAFLAKFFRDFYNTDILKDRLISTDAVQLSWITGARASPIATLDSVTA